MACIMDTKKHGWRMVMSIEHSARSFWLCTGGGTIYCDTLHPVFYTYCIVFHNITTQC